MIIRDAKIEAVAVRASQYPQDNMAEIAFAGVPTSAKSFCLTCSPEEKASQEFRGAWKDKNHQFL